MDVGQLGRVHGGGSTAVQVRGAGRLREGDHVADVVEAQGQGHQAIEADGEAAVGRGAAAKGPQQGAETRFDLLGGVAGDGEGAAQAEGFWSVETDEVWQPEPDGDEDFGDIPEVLGRNDPTYLDEDEEDWD